MLKSWFLERAEYDFEGHKFYGTKDYDGFLKYSYNILKNKDNTITENN